VHKPQQRAEDGDDEGTIAGTKRSGKDRKKDKKRRKKDKKNRKKDKTQDPDQAGVDPGIDSPDAGQTGPGAAAAAEEEEVFVPTPPVSATRSIPPVELDPRFVSPIFFGYARDDEEAQDLRLKADCNAKWEETLVPDFRLAKLKVEMEGLRERYAQRKERKKRERDAARERVTKKRETTEKQQIKERDVAKTVMNEKEFEHFIRDWINAKKYREQEQVSECQ
jgi:hypothetical protein